MKSLIILSLSLTGSISFAASEKCERSLVDLVTSAEAYGSALKVELLAIDELDNLSSSSAQDVVNSLQSKVSDAKKRRQEAQRLEGEALQAAQSTCQ